MTAKHTPGPWICHLGDESATCDCPYVLAEYGGMGSITDIRFCKKMKGPWGDDHGPSVEVAKANARLISAAPDLLYALRLFVDEYTELVNSGDAGFWNPEEEHKVIAARAAIAKAEGRS